VLATLGTRIRSKQHSDRKDDLVVGQRCNLRTYCSRTATGPRSHGAQECSRPTPHDDAAVLQHVPPQSCRAVCVNRMQLLRTPGVYACFVCTEADLPLSRSASRPEQQDSSSRSRLLCEMAVPVGGTLWRRAQVGDGGAAQRRTCACAHVSDRQIQT
jgi:hypothetical protein